MNKKQDVLIDDFLNQCQNNSQLTAKGIQINNPKVLASVITRNSRKQPEGKADVVIKPSSKKDDIISFSANKNHFIWFYNDVFLNKNTKIQGFQPFDDTFESQKEYIAYNVTKVVSVACVLAFIALTIRKPVNKFKV